MSTPAPSTPAPPLKRPAYHLWWAPEGVDPDTAADDELAYAHVVVNHSDQLRAELEAGRLKLDPRKHPMHLSSLWLWCAAVRLGYFTDGYAAWKRALITYEPDKDRPAPHTDPDDTEGDELDAHPTGASTG